MNTEKKELQILAHRYAVAFLNVYQSQLAETDYQGLQKAKSFFKNHRQACFLMKISLLDVHMVQDSLKEIRKKCGLSACFDRLLNLVLRHKRTFLLADIFSIMISEINKRNGILFFEVSFVGNLSAIIKDNIVKWLSKKTGKLIKCNYQEDKNLIAGLRLQSSNFLWETSIRSRLKSMYSALKR